MKPFKLLCIGLLLNPLNCLLLERADPLSPLSTFEVKGNAGFKSRSVSVFAVKMNDPDFRSPKSHISGNHRSWMGKHLSEFFRCSIPPAAIFPFFVIIASVGILCWIT
ncbi:small integral membrane protein 9 [Nannospalax galili]|uniref:small integral membrane protein 9 n=1 Tax=Nannospalax galili TaxID=1026970 RepID=UPI0004ED51D2|nr:small integral membrane protein 9 [Nannospalax galili]